LVLIKHNFNSNQCGSDTTHHHSHFTIQCSWIKCYGRHLSECFFSFLSGLGFWTQNNRPVILLSPRLMIFKAKKKKPQTTKKKSLCYV